MFLTTKYSCLPLTLSQHSQFFNLGFTPLWSAEFSSRLGAATNYSVSNTFGTFPLPIGFERSMLLEETGLAYHSHRDQLMLATDEGLTETYNRFHDPNERSAEIAKLRVLHDAMDRAVLEAYGWTDLETHLRVPARLR